MKIIVTSTTFPPQGNGVSHIAFAQATELAKRGHEVVVATDYDPTRDLGQFSDFKVKQFKIAGCSNLRERPQGEVAEYQKFIATEPADIILCNCWQTWATDLAAQVFPQTRARTVNVSQGFDAHLFRYYFGRSFGLIRWAGWLPYVLRFPSWMKRFDHVVFLSHRKDFHRFIDHRLAAWMGKPAYSIIPNGVHLEEIRAVRLDFRQLYGIKPTDFLILDVANYCDRKNQLATVRAFLRARPADTTLVFIGSELDGYGAECQRLYQKAAGVPGRILFLEKVPRPHIYAAYQAADAFILTAKEETQPLAILDAMATGIPFISTPAGCVEEMAGGIIVRNDEETAAAINRLRADSALAQRLGEEGRVAAETTYSWAGICAQYEAIFEELLKKKP